MHRLDQIKNGHKELIMMLTHKNILTSQPVNLIHLTQLKEQKNTTDTVTVSYTHLTLPTNREV